MLVLHEQSCCAASEVLSAALGAVCFVFCSSNSSSNFKKSECKFHGEGTLYVMQGPGCFAGIVHGLASARCCKAEERRGLCVCVYLYVYWYVQLCVWWAVDAAGVSPGPEDAAEFPRPVLGRCRRGFVKLWPVGCEQNKHFLTFIIFFKH